VIRFLTSTAEEIYSNLKPGICGVLDRVNEHDFDGAIADIGALRKVCDAAIGNSDQDDNVLRDLFALSRFVDLLESYAELWASVVAQEFAKSWNSVQDALDRVRLVKKFSGLDVSFFEDQLLELERAYPYKVFASMGAVVDRFDCSICGLDIDGDMCTHRRGELYGGSLAHGIAREIISLDHVSLVLDPVDKRCVITLDDVPLQFPVVDYISQLLRSGRMKVLSFKRLEWSKRRESNPDYGRLGRNDVCFCGSTKKFKHCCQGSAVIEKDHVDVVFDEREIPGPVV
jgi:hypothetical protein